MTQNMFDPYVGILVGAKYLVVQALLYTNTHKMYRVLDVETNKPWTMKVFSKADSAYASVYKNICRHPSIQQTDTLETEEAVFAIIENINGDSLLSVAERFGAQPAEKVIEWGKQLCRVLGALHEMAPPCFYFAVKPQNTILMPSGELKLLAEPLLVSSFNKFERMKQDFLIDMAPGYAAPEQFGGMAEPDGRADIYGLGMTMFHLVTGVNPGEPPYETKPICQLNPCLPKGLEYIISKCTQRNPEERYQNCSEVEADLNNYKNLPRPQSIFGGLFRRR